MGKSFTIRKAAEAIRDATTFKDVDFLVILFAATSKLTNLKVLPKSLVLHHGEFYIARTATAFQLTKKILKGEITYRRVKIPSGQTIPELIDVLNKTKGLVGTVDPNQIGEGSLFADTYFFQLYEDRQNLIDRMVQKMEDVLLELWQRKDEDLPYTAPVDGLIIASIIEKEAVLPEDKKKVASVFINRIKVGMKLQSDPTVQYMIDFDAYHRGIKKRGLMHGDFSRMSPFNTYMIEGLPQTPICNPDIDSLEAAFLPEKTDFYYFISLPGEVKLVFAKTYKEHLVNVERLRVARQIHKRRSSPEARLKIKSEVQNDEYDMSLERQIDSKNMET